MLVKQLISCVLFLTYSVNSQKRNTCNKYESYFTLETLGVVNSKQCYYNPYAFSNTGTMIELLGYKTENYTITTGDGYILDLIRVTPKDGVSKGAQPVFLQHGILMDSSCWIYISNNSLAVALMQSGYDLWLGNSRSTLYGRKHVNMTDKDKKYWDYNLDDMAANDIRGSLMKVAEITGQKGNIIYIGHSMGTTLSFMYSSRFSSDNLLRGIVSLCPVVFWDQKDIVTQGLRLVPPLGKVLGLFGVNSVFTNQKLTHNIISNTCNLFPRLCVAIFINTALGQSDLFTPKDLGPYFSYWPDAASLAQLVQFAQMAPTSKFSMYDYGKSKNKEKYGQEEPPQYDLSKVTIPVYLFYGSKDTLVKTAGVEKLYNSLGTDQSEKDYQIVPINNTKKSEQFGHIQFFSGDRIETLFYPDLFRYLKKLAPVT